MGGLGDPAVTEVRTYVPAAELEAAMEAAAEAPVGIDTGGPSEGAAGSPPGARAQGGAASREVSLGGGRPHMVLRCSTLALIAALQPSIALSSASSWPSTRIITVTRATTRAAAWAPVLRPRARQIEARQADRGQPSSFTRAATFPALTLVAAGIGLQFPVACAPLGSLAIFQWGLSGLMLSMGLSLTPADVSQALLRPRELALNLALCYVVTPLVAVALAYLLRLPAAAASGLVLLGCVSGGQASNVRGWVSIPHLWLLLCALLPCCRLSKGARFDTCPQLCAFLAGGDLALSVILTCSTTLLGVLATPALVQLLLGTAVAVDAAAVLVSIASLVLLPLVAGLTIGRWLPGLTQRMQPLLPRLGIAALLVLVNGGSANAATLLLGASGAWRAHAAAMLLPVASGGVALAAARAARLEERALRTVTIETTIKSPTLAFVLARKHFSDASVAAIPAASMVWLAAIGAVMASAWCRAGAASSSS